MFPVGDFLRTRTTPYVNWALLAANIAVFAYTLTLSTEPDAIVAGRPTSETDRFFLDWGLVAACLAEQFGFDTAASAGQIAAVCPAGGRELAQVVTSMFLHAGWAHIAGNMVFLWVFGDNVEDRMGHGRYLAFYLLCGVAAAVAQTVMASDTLLPGVGASGAVAGILGAYLMLHPTALVRVVVMPFFFAHFVVPAALLIVMWFVTQLLSGFAELGQATAGSGVAWWAHVGGFAAGAVLIWFFKQPRRRRALAG